MDTSNFFDFSDDGTVTSQEGLILLKDATEQDWDTLLSFTSTQRFKAGDFVIVAGDEADSLFLIAEGELEVLIPVGRNKSLKRLTMITAGSVIGEQSFFDEQPRSLTCRANTDGELYRLNRANFMVMSAKHPALARNLLLDLGKVVSLRLRQTTEFLAQGNR
ncbi:cyclic nucleotide-binding domain-containing protein [Pleionea sediminis]|uniref:cyclic nucleotide-binding domain-containing protein n=1 Tax=Pleionea sediminis TaxID=2569479 RepID=UPI001186B2DC|nr:cyclic nucleotide-binding domain-containing protein [Pleionea sediminis]